MHSALIVELLTSQHAVRLLLLMLCAVWDALCALKCSFDYQHNAIAIMTDFYSLFYDAEPAIAGADEVSARSGIVVPQAARIAVQLLRAPKRLHAFLR